MLFWSIQANGPFAWANHLEYGARKGSLVVLRTLQRSENINMGKQKEKYLSCAAHKRENVCGNLLAFAILKHKRITHRNEEHEK